MQLRALLAQATAQLAEAGVDTPALDARLLFQHASGLTHEALVAQPTREVTVAIEAQFFSYIRARLARTPVAQIVGTKPFWKDEFLVSRAVLTPRPETEIMLEALLRRQPNHSVPYRIAELGVGSGCLLLSALREYPNAIGVGVDISAQALEVARANAEKLGLSARIRWREGNWCEAFAQSETFDIVLSNPPYIPSNQLPDLAPELRVHEPALALDGGADGLNSYRAILSCLPAHLSASSVVLFEVGAGQAPDVAELAESCGFEAVETVYDLAQIARIVIVTFNATR